MLLRQTEGRKDELAGERGHHPRPRVVEDL